MTHRKHDAMDSLGLGGEGVGLPGTRPDLADAIHGEEAVLAALAALVPPADPPEGLLGAIETEIDALPSRWVTTQRADEREWIRQSDKVWTKILAEDPVSGRSIYLLRCEPGTVLPAHTRARDEHFFMIEGEYLIGDLLVLRAGDFQYLKAGSQHAEIRSETGCLVVVHA
jgi:quercetin dioxygenase-like cupin family protein